MAVIQPVCAFEDFFEAFLHFFFLLLSDDDEDDLDEDDDLDDNELEDESEDLETSLALLEARFAEDTDVVVWIHAKIDFLIIVGAFSATV